MKFVFKVLSLKQCHDVINLFNRTLTDHFAILTEWETVASIPEIL